MFVPYKQAVGQFLSYQPVRFEYVSQIKHCLNKQKFKQTTKQKFQT